MSTTTTAAERRLIEQHRRQQEAREARNRKSAERAAQTKAEKERQRRRREPILAGCSWCGGPVKVSALSTGASTAEIGAGPGFFTRRLCRPCDSAEMAAMVASSDGTIPAKYRTGYAIRRRLVAERGADFLPEDVDRLRPAHLARLVWAATVLEARDRGEPDPAPPDKPFDHLPRKWSAIDFPAVVERREPAPRPTDEDPRRVDHACGICGVVLASEPMMDPNGPVIGRRVPPTVAPSGVNAIAASWFGLEGSGPTGWILIRTCQPCRRWRRESVGVYDEAGTPGTGLAYSVTNRLREARPDLLPSDTGYSDRVINPGELWRWTFAGRVVVARESGETEPPTSATPFAFLDQGETA
jgi:hypothetical protein